MRRASRVALATAAYASFAAAFAATPYAVDGEPGSRAEPFRTAAVTPRPRIAALTVPRRDPFDDGGSVPAAARAPLPATRGASPAEQLPAALRALPPNAGAPLPPFPVAAGSPAVPLAADGVRVTAIAGGAHPYALVDEDGAVRLVTLGDRVAGMEIVAIGTGGVRLAGGRVARLTHPSPAAAGRPLR